MGAPDNNTFLKPSTIQELNSEWRAEETYVTRGAYMRCSCGTHEDLLNQTDVTGVFINDQQMMTVKDCRIATSEHINGKLVFDVPGDKIDGNLFSFGYCRSAMHPQKVGEKEGVMDGTYIFDVDAETEAPMSNKVWPCVPHLSGATEWQGGSEKVTINGVKALTSTCFLTCAYKGEITFMTNGMDPAPLAFKVGL